MIQEQRLIKFSFWSISIGVKYSFKMVDILRRRLISDWSIQLTHIKIFLCKEMLCISDWSSQFPIRFSIQLICLYKCCSILFPISSMRTSNKRLFYEEYNKIRSAGILCLGCNSIISPTFSLLLGTIFVLPSGFITLFNVNVLLLFFEKIIYLYKEELASLSLLYLLKSSNPSLSIVKNRTKQRGPT